jgi:flagellar biosynthetic protein FlhB
MAEGDDTERSEEASQKKLDDARKRGDVPKSQEVSAWFLLAGGLLAMSMFAGSASSRLSEGLKSFLAYPHAMAVDGAAFPGMVYRLALMIGSAVGLPFLILMLAAFSGHFIQHGLMWTIDPIVPKFSKISPMQGAKRIFSRQSLVTFGKGIIKLCIVGIAIWMTVWPERDKLGLLTQLDLVALGKHLEDLIYQMLMTTVIVLGVLAAADFMYQRHAWAVKQRMSVQELKEEYKQMEGDPTIKARIRQIRLERSRKRMMAQVPGATVVITNPTHYAIALKYEAGMNAPQCVAKGVDVIALRIREVAAENKVPVIENPPLARALYKQVDIDDFIPEEHYRVVAEIVGYVMRMKK